MFLMFLPQRLWHAFVKTTNCQQHCYNTWRRLNVGMSICQAYYQKNKNSCFTNIKNLLLAGDLFMLSPNKRKIGTYTYYSPPTLRSWVWSMGMTRRGRTPLSPTSTDPHMAPTQGKYPGSMSLTTSPNSHQVTLASLLKSMSLVLPLAAHTDMTPGSNIAFQGASSSTLISIAD